MRPRGPRPLSALFLQLPEAFAEAGLLRVHGAKLFKHTVLRVVEALHNRGQDMHVVAQGGHSGGQPLRLCQNPTRRWCRHGPCPLSRVAGIRLMVEKETYWPSEFVRSWPS